MIECGTIALGAEVYASETELKLVFHTCKSRFCTSCGQRATEDWQQDMAAILPNVLYTGITLTMPAELRPMQRFWHSPMLSYWAWNHVALVSFARWFVVLTSLPYSN